MVTGAGNWETDRKGTLEMSLLRGRDVMNTVNEKDWKLFRSRLPDWQEAYMDKLVKEYIDLLSGDKLPSDKFWTLEERVRQDKRNPGVLITEMRHSRMRSNLLNLLGYDVITVDDLVGFSKELRQDLEQIVKSRSEESQE